MSKRPSTDLNSTSMNKRAKRTLQRDSITSQSEFSSQGSDNLEHYIEFNQQDLNELKSKVNKVLKESQNEVKITELTNMFKEIIDTSSAKNKQKLGSLFTTILEYLGKNSMEMDDKLVSQFTLLLSLQIDSLPSIVLKDSIDLFISQIRAQKPYNEKSIELFVEIFRHIHKIPFSDLDKTKSIEQENNNSNEYVRRKISDLLAVKWTQSTALNALNLIRTIQLDQNELKSLLIKLFDINEINWSNIQIPNLINLVLSFTNSKQNRNLIFENIIQFFIELRKNTSNQINVQKNDFIDAESLSIMHIIHLIKTELSLGKDIIKILKLKLNRNLNELVQPFTFGLLLALINVLPSQDGVIDLLRQIVTRIYESEINHKKYYWVAKTFSEEEKKLTSYLIKPSKCRLYFNDQILSGLIEFLFELFETNGIRMSKFTKPVSLNEKITLYASEMLRDLFRNSKDSRDKILNKLTERIFSSNVNKSIVYIDQLTILILSEPASSFQDYFRKFKNRLDHMIYMSPIVALEFLTSIKPLLKYDTSYKDNLIITLKKSVYQNDVDIRKVGLNGLVCMLTQTKLSSFLPSSQASQSMSLSQTQSQISRMPMSQERNSEKNCLEIFLSLRRCLSQQVEIRSRLYQSCCSLVSQNNTLIGPTLNLLLTAFENYLIKSNLDLEIDFTKCLKLNDLNEIEIVEPLDILMHAVHLCDDKYNKSGLRNKEEIDEDIKKHSETINTYFDQIKQTFLSKTQQYIIETYKNQVNLKFISTKNTLSKTLSTTQNSKQTQSALSNKNNSADINTSMAFYQCLLGSIEVLIEHFFTSGALKATRDLYKKFNLVYDLVHKQFTLGSDESILKKKTNQTPSKIQKKKNPKNKKDAKKENKENMDLDENEETENQEDEIKATAYDQSKMADLTSLEQNPLLESTTNGSNASKLNKKGSKSSSSSKKQTLPKFNYLHRISYSCLLKLLDVYYSDKHKLVKIEPDDYSEETVEEFLLQIQGDESFHNYLIKVLNQQLDLILNESNYLKTNVKSDSNLSYDAESNNEKDLFKYLNQLWILFWQQLSLSKCKENECSNLGFYCEECIKSKTIYLKILSNIWRIVSIKFNPKLNELFSFSVFGDSTNDSITQSNTSNCSNVAVGILDQCRRFIDRCISDEAKYVSSSFKLANQLLEFMYEISNNIALKLDDYNNLFKWNQQLTNEKEINDQQFVRTLFKFFTFITWNKNSSTTLMKYLCQDLTFFYPVLKTFRPLLTETENEQYFTCLTSETALSILNVICDELTNQLNLLEWFISFKTDKISITAFYKQLNCILECLKILLIIDLPVGYSQEQIIRFTNKFYTFMNFFCKSITTREVIADEEKLLKAAVDFTASQIQNPLTHFISKVQNTNSNSSLKDKDSKNEKSSKLKGKDTGDSNSRASKTSKMIPNLVYLNEQYEHQLKALNKHFKDKINFTENFEVRLKDFRIVLSNDQAASDYEGSYSPTEDNEETNDGETVVAVKRDQSEEEIEDEDE